jgi:hypothetical protein
VTKDEMIDAAVAVVEQEAREALAKPRPMTNDGFVTAHAVANKLVAAGVITHDRLDSKGMWEREAARKSVDGKAKRLLDAEAAKPNARVRRFSSTKDAPPRLTGTRGRGYGREVTYTSVELLAKAEEVTVQAEAKDQADELRMDNALEQAAALGLPAGRARALTITFTVDEFVTLLQKVVSG